MELLRTIRQKDIGLDGAHEVAGYKVRHAARAVLRDDRGRTALLYAAKRQYYKLPGGGVEEGDDMALALARELLEEVGAVATVTGEIGRIEEWRDNGSEGLHQLSDAYLAEVSGAIGEPDFTDDELADGFSIVWTDTIDEAIQLVKGSRESTDAGVRFMSLRDETILRTAKDML